MHFTKCRRTKEDEKIYNNWENQPTNKNLPSKKDRTNERNKSRKKGRKKEWKKEKKIKKKERKKDKG